MAKVNHENGKMTLTVTPEEMLDMRKHALDCAVRLYANKDVKNPLVLEELLALADKFNIHLLRNPGANG